MSVVNLASDGLDIAVLLFPHEWSVNLSIAHRFPSRVDAGQSGREGRRPKAEDLRHKLSLHFLDAGDEAQAFRQMLATIGKGWVGVPLWCDQHAGADWAERKYDPERLYDLTDNAIVAKGAELDDAHDYAPLLVGHIVDLPPENADDAEQGDATFVIVEDSPWTFRIGINAVVAAGAWPEGIEPDWSDQPQETPERALEFDQIGNQREQTIDNEESVFRWRQAAPFTLADDDEIRTLLAFFVASGGMWKKFDTPLWYKPGDPTAEAPHTTKARFASDTLTLDYLSASAATCKVEIAQLPWELVGVEGEEPEQPPRVAYYRFEYKLPVPIIYRFTNWPRPLDRTADGTYAPAPMQHRSIPDALDIKSNKVVLDSFDFAGNPLTLWQPNRIEAPLVLSIYESENWPIDPDLAVRKFYGEVKRPKRDSRKIEAPVIFLPGILEREFPRVLFGPICNTSFCSALCGLNRADFLKAGTLAAKDASGTQLTITTDADEAENVFALGQIEIGAGADYERREIVASEPIEGGGQLLTVDWPVRQAAAGQDVSFIRGCDRTWETCQALGNGDRFRAVPHIPQVNLSLPSMALPNAPGKK